MKQSQFFVKTLREAPSDETSAGGSLLVRGGFVDKNSSGVYSFLPLGLRVLERINKVIREEMNALGASELLMPALVSKKYWETTDRWDTDVLYKVTDSSKQEYGLAFTHEEVLTPLLKKFISSYRDLPFALYQIQTKFRDEPRARAGLLRTKEFVMKDLYSFHANAEDLESFYRRAADAYKKIFARLGLDAKITEAAGGGFTEEYTHEFQVLNEAGEDEVFFCSSCNFAQNKEITKVSEGDPCPKCKKDKIKKGNGIEVGNIFKLGTRFSASTNLTYKDEEGKENFVVMGSYGIGSSRAMGAIAEIKRDEKGFLWPTEASPFTAHLLALNGGEKQAEEIYNAFKKENIEVLYDDRVSASAGEKLMNADLLGMVWRVVASKKTAEKNKIEVKRRDGEKARLMDLEEALRVIKG